MATTQTFYNPYTVHRGPHPGIVATVHVVLFMASLVLIIVLTKGNGFPTPYGDLQKTQQAMLQYAQALQINAFLQFGAAIPLGIFTAAVTSRLKFLGVNVTGVNIAFFGGITASLFMTVSSLCTWILAQPGVANDINVMHAIQLLGFATGGNAHVAALGLLMAGIAVPCLFGKYTPKWIAWLGLILAAFAELSAFGLIFYLAEFCLPIARFGFYVWMIATGFTLVKNNDQKKAV
jgi:hypothetical protein